MRFTETGYLNIMSEKIRVADFIMQRLYDRYGINFVSLITGNGALVLNDALFKMKDKITPICVHHEADAGYFCLGYSKYTNKLSVCTPTTGCAGTNTITPLLAAYQDHVPVLFLSGNVALKQTSRYHKRFFHFEDRAVYPVNLKKLGTQEADIIEIVKSLTKYSVMITEAKMIQYELDKAIEIALTPPYGPVWVDLPADIGASLINEEELEKYEKLEEDITCIAGSTIAELKQDLETYQRPLILCGNGVRLSDTKEQLKIFIEKYKLPCVFTYGGIDLLDYNHELWTGVIGVKGTRAGNFALQNCDLFLCLGVCLNVPQVGYMSEKFALRAKKIVVDLCEENHRKNTVKVDKIIECELGEFFKHML